MRHLVHLLTLLVTWQLPAQTLRDYLQMAAEQNPGLQANYKAFEASLQRVAQIKALPDPNVSFGYFISSVETRVGPQRTRISLSQMFPWFGTLKAQQDAAALLAEADYQTFLEARNQLYREMSNTYYSLYELQQLIEKEEDNVLLLESYKHLATRRFENGQGSMVDVLRVDILLKESRTEAELLSRQRYSLQVAFNRLLDRSDSEVVILNKVMAFGDSMVLTDASGRDSGIAGNPRVAALRLKAQSFENQQIVAQKQSLPKVGVGLDYVLIDKRSDMVMDDNGKDALMPMVSLSLPVYRKKYKASRKEAALMQESYELQQRELTNELVSVYEDTRFKLQRQQELLALYDEQIGELHQSLNLQLSAYRHSNTNFEELLEVQQQLLKYEKRKIKALADLLKAEAEMNYITSNYE